MDTGDSETSDVVEAMEDDEPTPMSLPVALQKLLDSNSSTPPIPDQVPSSESNATLDSQGNPSDSNATHDSQGNPSDSNATQDNQGNPSDSNATHDSQGNTLDSTDTHDSKGNAKWLGYKTHMENMLKDDKTDKLRPAFGGFKEFEARVESGKIKKGYLIYVARTLEETSPGQKLGPLCLLLSHFVEAVAIDQKYLFAHVAIYVGKWEGIHYFVENGGSNTGREFLTGENANKKNLSAIRLIEAKQVLINETSPFLAMTIPFGKVIEVEDQWGRMKKRKQFPGMEETVQRALASVGFPFKYDIRTRSCETYAMLLYGIGEYDESEAFPQLELILKNASELSKRIYIGSGEVTEDDKKAVAEFRDDFRKWMRKQDPTDRIDTSAFKVKGGVVVIEEQVLDLESDVSQSQNLSQNGHSDI